MNFGYSKSSASVITMLVTAGLCFAVGKAVSTVPLVPLIIIVSIFLFLFAFLYTEMAMVLLIIAMLLSPEFSLGALSSQQDIVVRIDDLLIVVFMLAWVARTSLTRNAHLFPKLPINRFLAFYLITFIIATTKGVIVGQVTPLKGMFYMFKYIEYLMVFYLAIGILRTRDQMRMYLKVFIIVFAIVNIYAFTQIGSVDRVSAPFEGRGEPNTLGGYQVLLIAVILGLLTHSRFQKWRIPLVGLVLFSLVPFGHTLSRASYMAIIPMYLTLVFFNKTTTRTILIGAMLVGALMFMFFAPEKITHRLSVTFVEEYQEGITPVKIMGVTLDPSASSRINDWMDLFELWKRQPFLGYGLTGAGFVDSQFIKVLVETGLVGFVSFSLLLGHIFFQTLKIYRRSKDDLYRGLSIGFLAGHVGMLCHALTANTFILIRIMEPYWFLAAMVMMIPKLEGMGKNEGSNSETPRTPDENQIPYMRNIKFLLNSGWKV